MTRKKKLKVCIEYTSKQGHICPMCVEDALKSYQTNAYAEYKLENLRVEEIK